jgi:hypothetical protein
MDGEPQWHISEAAKRRMKKKNGEEVEEGMASWRARVDGPQVGRSMHLEGR